MSGNHTAHEVYADKHPKPSFERHLAAQVKAVGRDAGRGKDMDLG